MYNIYMHTHNTRTPCPVLGGSLFLSCLVLLSSAQWSHALHFSRGGGCSTSLSSPRKRHIHHNESPYSHAARHTINKRNSSCVCSTEKKKANNQHDKNKKMLDKKQTSCLFQPLHNKAKNTYFATSVKQLKKHQHGFRTHKNPQNKFGKASDRGGGGNALSKHNRHVSYETNIYIYMRSSQL